MLTQLEAVEYLMTAYPDRFVSSGWAVRALLDKAMAQVITLTDASPDNRTRRIARFLEARRIGRSVSEIAQDWELSRECVSRTVGRQAVVLVTDRLLALGRRKLAPAHATAQPARIEPIRSA